MKHTNSLFRQLSGQLVNEDTVRGEMAMDLNKPKEAEPYMLQSLINSAAKLMTSLMSYAFILSKRKEYKNAEELLKTGLDLIGSLHMGKEIDIAYKLSAVYYALMAYTRLRTGKKEEAGGLLKKAAAMTVRFDESPDYGIREYIVDLSDRVILYALKHGNHGDAPRGFSAMPLINPAGNVF